VCGVCGDVAMRGLLIDGRSEAWGEVAEGRLVDVDAALDTFEEEMPVDSLLDVCILRRVCRCSDFDVAGSVGEPCGCCVIVGEAECA